MKAAKDEEVKTEETPKTGNGNPKGFIGRYRLQSQVSHLHNQIQIIQDELNKVDSIDPPSTLSNQLIAAVESAPDPLLPMTKGPVDMSWERWWLGGASSSTSHRRWL